jgi:hypothetical protein
MVALSGTHLDTQRTKGGSTNNATLTILLIRRAHNGVVVTTTFQTHQLK